MINSHIHLDFDSVKSPSKTTTGVIVPSIEKIIQVAERVAKIKKITVEQVIEQCDQNTCKLFNLA